MRRAQLLTLNDKAKYTFNVLEYLQGATIFNVTLITRFFIRYDIILKVIAEPPFILPELEKALNNLMEKEKWN